MAPTRNQQEKGEMKQLIKETILEIFKNKDFVTELFKPIYDKLDLQQKESENIIKTLQNKIDVLEQKIDDIQQIKKINNICIHGITDEKEENIISKVTNILKSTIPNINMKNINAHRIGKEVRPGKTRPVIVKFDSSEEKKKLFKSLKNFKGTKVYICEDLTRLRLELMNAAKNIFGGMKVWTVGGDIYVNIDGKSVRIKNFSQLREYQKEQ